MTSLAIIPTTGEQLDLTAPDEQLVEWFDELRDAERQVKEIRDAIAGEITARCDRRAKWSFSAHGLKVSVPSPAPKTEWDIDALRSTLASMQAEGLDEDAVDAALEPVVTWKVRLSGLNAIRKLSTDHADRIDACGVQVDPVRRVSVRRA